MKQRNRLRMVIGISWCAVLPALVLPYIGIAPALMILGLAYWIAGNHLVEDVSPQRVAAQFLLLVPTIIVVALLRSLSAARLLSDLMTDILGITAVVCAVAWLYPAAYLDQRLARKP